MQAAAGSGAGGAAEAPVAASRLARAVNDLRVRIKNRLLDRRSDCPFTLGVIGIMKNEARNIDEWIGHYLWQGAERIYLIDNGSTDGTAEKLKPWLADGRVKSVYLPAPHRQWQHYWTAIRRFGVRRECEWLLVADLDEFWFCRDGRTIREALAGFGGIDVIYANWSIFGSGGRKAHPASLRRDLVLRQPGLGHHGGTKWICRTRRLRRRADVGIHKIRGSCSSRTVSDNTVFQLNHYMTQSEEYFRAVKMTRGDAANPVSDGIRDMAYFERIDAACTVEDRLLADMVETAEG
jgi:hypothetical protein